MEIEVMDITVVFRKNPEELWPWEMYTVASIEHEVIYIIRVHQHFEFSLSVKERSD